MSTTERNNGVKYIKQLTLIVGALATGLIAGGGALVTYLLLVIAVYVIDIYEAVK